MPRVYVYRNLARDVFSLRSRVDGRELVTAHARHVLLNDVEFRVRPGTRDRVRQTKQKDVHAFVIGDVLSLADASILNSGVRYLIDPVDDTVRMAEGIAIPVTYNPYKFDNFVRVDDGTEVFRAPRAFLTFDGDKPKVLMATTEWGWKAQIAENAR